MANGRIDTHWQHNLVVKPDGTVLAWGNDSYNLNTNHSITIQMADGTPLKQVVAVSAGSAHSLALLQDGSVMAWGWNDIDQLGDGTTASSATPVKVKYPNGQPLQNIVAIAASGNFSLALKSDGTVLSWGVGSEGQLGQGNNPVVSAPPGLVKNANGSPLTGVIGITAGGAAAFALRSDGTVLGWGTSNALGSDNPNTQYYPQRVVDKWDRAITKIRAIRINGSGLDHAIARDESNHLFSWGSNYYGELGVGYTDGNGHLTSTPVLNTQGTSLENISAIAAGAFHNLAITTSGTLMSWGYNNSGQLGDGTNENKYFPTQINYPEKILEIAAGVEHSLILTESGKIMSWGYNGSGQLGDGTLTTRYAPVAVTDQNGNPVILNLNDNDGDGINNDADPDDDNDGMPDTWENQYGFDPFDQTDALQDKDGDGLNNAAEYTHGTNPAKQDTDGDSLTDKQEVDAGRNPLVNEAAIITPILQLLLQ